jgi:hypothetical protein
MKVTVVNLKDQISEDLPPISTVKEYRVEIWLLIVKISYRCITSRYNFKFYFKDLDQKFAINLKSSVSYKHFLERIPARPLYQRDSQQGKTL